MSIERGVKAMGTRRLQPWRSRPAQNYATAVLMAEICKDFDAPAHHSLEHTGGSGGCKQDKQVLRCRMAAKHYRPEAWGFPYVRSTFPPVFATCPKRLVGDQQQSAVRILHRGIQPFQKDSWGPAADRPRRPSTHREDTIAIYSRRRIRMKHTSPFPMPSLRRRPAIRSEISSICR